MPEADRDYFIESDAKASGVGDIVFATGRVERARIKADGTGTGWAGVVGGSLSLGTTSISIEASTGDVLVTQNGFERSRIPSGRLEPVPAFAFSNPNAAGMKVWRQKLRDVRNQAAKARVFFCGDSITYGYGAGNNTTDNFPTLVGEMLAAYVGAASQGLIYTDSTNAFGGTQKRSYITVGAGWTSSAGYGLAGNATLSAPAATVPSVDIGPFYCDNFTVWYMRRATTGTFDISVDAGAATTVGSAGADALLSSTINCVTLANHTLHLKNVVGGSAIIIAVEPTIGGASVGTGVYVANGGVPGSKTADWSGSFGANPWSTDNIAWTTPQPHLTVIALGVNDHSGNIVPATFQANLDTIVVKALLYGSVLLVVPPQRIDVVGTYAWSQYVTAIKAVGTARACPVLDIGALWGNTIAAYNSDGVHPTSEGHYQIARAIFYAITNG